MKKISKLKDFENKVIFKGKIYFVDRHIHLRIHLFPGNGGPKIAKAQKNLLFHCIDFIPLDLAMHFDPVDLYWSLSLLYIQKVFALFCYQNAEDSLEYIKLPSVLVMFWQRNLHTARDRGILKLVFGNE